MSQYFHVQNNQSVGNLLSQFDKNTHLVDRLCSFFSKPACQDLFIVFQDKIILQLCVLSKNWYIFAALSSFSVWVFLFNLLKLSYNYFEISFFACD